MYSCQMRCFVYWFVCGIWMVAGKPSSSTPDPILKSQEIPFTSHPLQLDGNSGHFGIPLNEEIPSSFNQVEYVYIPKVNGQGLPLEKLNVKTSNLSRMKRTPSGFSARGFHDGAFDRDFGHFSPVKRMFKRRPEADAAGFYGDTFSNGFGEFETMKRDINDDFQEALKRTEMGATGFHGDTFNQGFGNFNTMKRQIPLLIEIKRKPEMTKSGFHGDIFNGGFGEFHPMKK